MAFSTSLIIVLVVLSLNADGRISFNLINDILFAPWVIWVNWQALGITTCHGLASILGIGMGVMAGLAKGLQVLGVKCEVKVAAMGLDVVNGIRRHDIALGLAIAA